MNNEVPMPKLPEPPPLPENDLPPPRLVKDDFTPLDGKPGLLEFLEALLKTPKSLFSEIQAGQARKVALSLMLLIAVFLSGYGIVTGLFSGGSQWIWAPVKIVAMVMLSGLICLPSLYIFTCLSQVEMKIWEMIAHTCAAICLVSILLVGFMPVLFIFTMSTESLKFMGFMHIIIWIIAGIAGSRFLLTSFRYLRGSPSGYSALWIFIFSLVLMQMSTTLRPILGSSDDVFTSEKKFFLSHWLQPEFSANAESGSRRNSYR